MSTIITHRQFPGYHKYEMELAGRPLTLEVGKLAELANAAVMVGYGDTRVLVCATASARFFCTCSRIWSSSEAVICDF